MLNLYGRLAKYQMKQETIKPTYAETIAATTLYSACMRNAENLLEDAELLIKHKRYPPAYFLALTAKEEINKGQIVADYANGFIPKKELIEVFRKHFPKLAYVGVRYANIEGKIGSYRFREKPDKVKSLFDLRNTAIYVSFAENMKPVMPGDMINRKIAVQMVQTVSAQIAEIHTMAFMTERIGSASFLK